MLPMRHFHPKVIDFSLLAEHHTSSGAANVRLGLIRLPGGHLLLNFQADDQLTVSYGWVTREDQEEYLVLTLREGLNLSSIYPVETMTRRCLPRYAVEHVCLQQLDPATWRAFILLAGGAQQLLDVALRNIPPLPLEMYGRAV